MGTWEGGGQGDLGQQTLLSPPARAKVKQHNQKAANRDQEKAGESCSWSVPSTKQRAACRPVAQVLLHLPTPPCACPVGERQSFWPDRSQNYTWEGGGEFVLLNTTIS